MEVVVCLCVKVEELMFYVWKIAFVFGVGLILQPFSVLLNHCVSVNPID